MIAELEYYLEELNADHVDFERVLFGVFFLLAGSIVAILALIGGINIIGIFIAIILIVAGYYMIRREKNPLNVPVAEENSNSAP
jgi:predicted membrane protein